MTLPQVIRFWLLHFSIPLQKLMQKLSLPEPSGRAAWAREISKNFEPGDILVTREKWHFTNLTIPGFYSHAAMMVSSVSVIEALPDGVIETDLFEFILKKDFVAHLRVNYVNIWEREAACKIGLGLKFKPYDYEFQYSADLKKNNAFYCSEVPWFCFKDTPFAKIFKPKLTMGVVTIVPQDYRDAANGVKMDLIGEYGLKRQNP